MCWLELEYAVSCEFGCMRIHKVWETEWDNCVKKFRMLFTSEYAKKQFENECNPFHPWECDVIRPCCSVHRVVNTRSAGRGTRGVRRCNVETAFNAIGHAITMANNLHRFVGNRTHSPMPSRPINNKIEKYDSVLWRSGAIRLIYLHNSFVYENKMTAHTHTQLLPSGSLTNKLCKFHVMKVPQIKCIFDFESSSVHFSRAYLFNEITCCFFSCLSIVCSTLFPIRLHKHINRLSSTDIRTAVVQYGVWSESNYEIHAPCRCRVCLI